MRTIRSRKGSALPRTAILALCILAGLGARSVALAYDVALVAGQTTTVVRLPDGTMVAVPMWGFGLDDGRDCSLAVGAVTVPGPRLSVPPGDATLRITLRNCLPPLSESVSIMIPGQQASGAPVVTGGRIVSMAPEATAGGGSETYTFQGVRPGTYLYHSASHPAVQVQMGLYGAMTKNVTDPVAATETTAAVPGVAYSGVEFDHEVLLLYSEIDIGLHQAVATGTYGNPALGGPTSTIDYAPSLYLVNGASYANDLLTPPMAAGAAGQRTLLRLLNAGLKSHAPVIDNATFSVIAEDGHPYPFARPQAALLLAAGKTHDALWIPLARGTYSTYDRLLGLTAPGRGSAGMLVKLAVRAPEGTPTGPVIAVADFYTGAAEDVTFSSNPASVLDNDTGATGAQLLTQPNAGTVALAGDGTFVYTPAADFFGVDSFTYRAIAGTNASDPVMAIISVTGVSDAPVATAQDVGVNAGDTVPIVLAATDADRDPVTFYLTSLPASGTLSIVDPVTSIATPLVAADLFTGLPQLSDADPDHPRPIPDGALLYAAGAAGTPSFAFVAVDPAPTASTPATVSITVHATETTETCATCTPVTIGVTGTDGTTITAFRWTVEEDRTFAVSPGDLSVSRTLSVNFHRSYMPVVQTGVAPAAQPSLDFSAGQRYFVSVLPSSGEYANGGAAIAPGATSVNVLVAKGPLPTAQIRVRVFRDDAPLNNMWDNVETGLTGFAVTLEDAGGRYGMSAGQAMMDAFGNPLGTRYTACAAPPCDAYEVLQYGNGFLLTDADGYALFENLVPGKYGVKVIPPAGEAWQQTTTIEGTKAIDAWVKANEPSFFTEFGPPGPHAIIGFTQRVDLLSGGGTTITGRITNLHLSRPPDASMYSGAPFDFTTPWVALNEGTGAAGILRYAQPTTGDGQFTIESVPPGSYTLVVFDTALDIIIASRVLNICAPGDTAPTCTNPVLGDVPVFQWFTRLYNYVFDDPDENGFRNDGEAGVPEQAINIRWRDGSMYQSSATDGSGFVPFEEVFPFFSWLVAEVDFTRHKATGVTVVVDNGGNPNTPANAGWPTQVGAELDPAVLVPQPQSENGGAAFRTETGPVLLQAFQGFLGQSNVLLWGKTPYAPVGTITTDVNVWPFDDFPGPGDADSNGNGAFDGDQFHGGVSGIVHYSTTRAENDPRWGFAEPWEPGIPGVRVQLWDRTRTRLLNEVTTDSWDGNQPAGCQGEVFVYRGTPRDCYDGLRNWNQVRPGVFDGGYAFLSQIEPITVTAGTNWLTPVAARGSGFREVPLPAGQYVVKVIAPAGYEVVAEEDKNVDFGIEFIPQQFLLSGYPLGDGGPSDPAAAPRTENTPLAAPFCVGALRDVPADLSLFPGVPGTYAGEKRPMCDAKLVTLRAGQNPGANFFLFTPAPVAAHIVGFVLDDTANEFDPNSPQFGEKYAPPFLPVSIRDFAGREVARTHTDAYGRYNVLVPSTFTANVPAPSGMSPNMLTACVNAPTLASGLPDPYFDKRYSHFCYTLQYMPGTTTYLDTPVLPTGAFAGADQFPVDAEFPNQTPVIRQVSNNSSRLAAARGPYVVDCGTATTGLCAGPAQQRNFLRRVVIQASSAAQVPNPYYDGLGGTQPKLIARDHGFGPSSLGGEVRLNGAALPASAISQWSPEQITVIVPPGSTTGQLTVHRCLARSGGACTSWRESVVGVTLTVATPTLHQERPPVVVSAGSSIQAAIDAASPGALILVGPGTYEEMLLMSKPVRLQGWGAAVTRINVVQSPAERLQTWRDAIGSLFTTHPDFLLPDQANILGTAPFADGALAAALGGEGSGVTVLGRNIPNPFPDDNPNDHCGPSTGTFDAFVAYGGLSSGDRYCLQNEAFPAPFASGVYRPNARIDGFSIHGSSNAAGIVVNGNARHVEIANNRIFNNLSQFAGGIKVGHPGAELPLADDDANNARVAIHNNHVTENAGLAASAGGGIAIGTGAMGYVVRNNWVAGNFTGGQGAGISHKGLSPGGVIDRNVVVFNESFNQGATVSGGGLFIGGRAPTLAGATPGAGGVTVSNNLIQGNQAAAGDGGGIALAFVNGQDVADPDVPDHHVDLFNNIIANNEAGLAGGGIALQDAVSVAIVHTTITHNDSLGTAGAAFTTSRTTSTPQPAGIVSRGNTSDLPPGFSSPAIVNSIVWENRSFYFGPTPGGVIGPGGTYGLLPATAANAPLGTSCQESGTWRCWDLGVLGAGSATLAPQYSVLTSTTGYGANNTQDPPAFVAQYVNGARNQTIVLPEQTTILAPAAFDEGGNFIRPLFGPLTLTQQAGAFWSNHHVTAGVTGQSLHAVYPPTPGGPTIPGPLYFDVDGDLRDLPSPHRGADQVVAPVPATPMPRAGR